MQAYYFIFLHKKKPHPKERLENGRRYFDPVKLPIINVL